jgi:hypothetical protein
VVMAFEGKVALEAETRGVKINDDDTRRTIRPKTVTMQTPTLKRDDSEPIFASLSSGRHGLEGGESKFLVNPLEAKKQE